MIFVIYFDTVHACVRAVLALLPLPMPLNLDPAQPLPHNLAPVLPLPMPLKLAPILPLPLIFYYFHLVSFMTLRAVLASLPLPMPLNLAPALPLPMPLNIAPALPLPIRADIRRH